MFGLPVRLSLAAIVLALVLVGCGQKGDLYWPEPEEAATSHF